MTEINKSIIEKKQLTEVTDVLKYLDQGILLEKENKVHFSNDEFDKLKQKIQG